MSWVLILMIYGGYASASPAVAMADFNTKAACEAAGAAAIDKDGQPMFLGQRDRFLCEPKG